MNRSSKGQWQNQVSLLLKVLPIVFKESCFALKGGTAINLFVRNMPRLSVDIDLAYLSNEPRADAIPHIQDALKRIASQLIMQWPGLSVHKSFEGKADSLKLILIEQGVTVKVELSPVLRGTVFEAEVRVVVPQVEDEFGYAKVPVVSLPDLYGGKICAALDRQHPRDLFDVHLLLQNEGVTESIRKAFLVYLLSHPRPMVELLRPRLKDLTTLYANELSGMTSLPTTLEELTLSFKQLVRLLQTGITQEEKELLVSVMRGEPQWNLLGISGYNDLPAVKWKMQNIAQMDVSKRNQAVQELETILRSNEPWL
jgi:predicted nucleotidyltransferase component of viral defense system